MLRGCMLHVLVVAVLAGVAFALPMPQAIGHISNGSGNPESDIRVIDFGGGLKTRFRADQITPGTREALAITVGLCDGGTLANTQATILVPVAGAPPTVAGGLASIPCIPSAGTDGLATGINGAVLTFSGPLAKFMGTVRMYADVDLDGVLFEPGELVTQGVPIFNAGTGEAIVQFGRQGQILTVGATPLVVPDATPVPLLVIFTVDIDSSAPGGTVNVALGLGVGDDTAQGAFGICAVAFGFNCGSNLMRSGPEVSSFTVVGPSPGPGPGPSPAPGGVKQFDTNGNCVIDDGEFFKAIDSWVQGQISNALFFQVVDAWIAQRNVCVSGSALRGLTLTLRTTHRGIAFQAQGPEITALEVRIYDLAGREVYAQEAAGSRLVWNYLDTDGQPVANGVYLYVAEVKGTDGQTLRSEVRKLVVLR